MLKVLTESRFMEYLQWLDYRHALRFRVKRVLRSAVMEILSIVLWLHFWGADFLAFEHRIKERVMNHVHATTDRVAEWAGYERPIPVSDKREWKDIAQEQARLRHLNSCLVQAVITVESADGARLVSTAGALGHMQLMRETARTMCDIRTDSDRMDVEQNIYCGVKLLSLLIQKYGVFRGLQVYNAGPARVNMTEENRLYPFKVLDEWSKCENET